MEILDAETKVNRKPSVSSVFKNSDFFKLWIGQFISNVGSNISLIVLPLFIFQYTGSTYWLGIITLAEFIPVLVISPIAGMYVDSHNRKKIMILGGGPNRIGQGIVLIPVLITFDQTFDGIYILIGITALVFLGSTVNRFFMPARTASIPRIVNQDEIGIAVSISQTTYQLIMVLGPIFGAIIATFFGYRLAFIVDGSTFLFSASVILLIKTDLNPLKNLSKDIYEKPSLLLGTKKLFQIKSLRFLVILFSVLIFANASINSFLVAFVKSDLHMTDIEFGTTITILGGSGVLTGIIMSKKISQVRRPIMLVVIGFLLSGISFLPIKIVTQAWQLYILFFFLGSFNLLINIPVNTIFLRDTTDNIRGQVFSALNMAISFFTILGILYGVIFAPILGLRDLYFLNAVIFVIVALIGMFYLIFIENLDNPQETIKVEEPRIIESVN